MLADVGADVIKVEPPAATSRAAVARSPATAPIPKAAGCSSTSTPTSAACRRPSTPEGQALLDRCSADADILIHNVPPAERATSGLDSAELCAAYPGLIVTSISMFGDRGPRARLARLRADGLERRRLGVPQPGRVALPRAAAAQAVRRAVRFPRRRVRRVDIARRPPRHSAAHGQGPGDRRLRAGGDRGDARDELDALDLRGTGDIAPGLARRSGRGSSPTARTGRSSRWRSKRSSGSDWSS